MGRQETGLNNYSHSQNDTETNLLLGTSYMRIVMESLDERLRWFPQLANAGSRLGACPLQAGAAAGRCHLRRDHPFNETHGIMKGDAIRLLSALFEGKFTVLKPRLGTIGLRRMLRRAAICPSCRSGSDAALSAGSSR